MRRAATCVFPERWGQQLSRPFGIIAAKTGLSEQDARMHGLNGLVSVTHPLDHAGYYPGAEALHMKLVVEHEDRASFRRTNCWRTGSG